MTDQSGATKTLIRLPPWVTPRVAKNQRDVAFLSGAALATLDLALRREKCVHKVLRSRLALRAAEHCAQQSGQSARAAEFRDALAFLRPGDQPGPAGALYLAMQRATERPLSIRTLSRALPEASLDEIANWLGSGQGAAISQAAAACRARAAARRSDLHEALLLGDAAMARALAWAHIVPLLSYTLSRADVTGDEDSVHFACHRATVVAAEEVLHELADVTRRASRLRAVSPKLRAKGAEEAVEIFLSRESVPATALTSLRSDRAARRFCDRLVALGAIRERTGRDTFRLYGL